MKQVFWEEKILNWEFSRYERPGSFGKNGSVAARLREAQRLLASVVRGKTVLELGCGSGRLAESLLTAGASAYVGCDLSYSAISVARDRLAAAGFAARSTFVVGSALELAETKADVGVSLGLLDWLEPAELTLLFSRLDCRYQLHSFSEFRAGSLEQLLHRAYVYLSYGRKTGSYRPRYLDAGKIHELYRPTRFVRSRALKFGVLAHNLDAE